MDTNRIALTYRAETMLLRGWTGFRSPSLKSFTEEWLELIQQEWSDWLIDFFISVYLTRLYVSIWQEAIEGNQHGFENSPDFIIMWCANAQHVNCNRGRIQQGLVNYWLAQRASLHWHLSIISTKVLVFWSRLRGRSHLAAGRVSPWWFCLQCSLETVPHVLLCLPAARRTAVGFLSIPFHFSTRSPQSTRSPPRKRGRKDKTLCTGAS